jgi:hypothetical protein
MLKSLFAYLQHKMLVAVVACTAALLAVPALASATESPAETKVKTLAETINTEGISIFLIIVTAISALIALVIAVTLGIRKARGLVK